VAFIGNSLPKGWLPCDGRSLSRALYPDLFNVMGHAYTPRHWWQRLFGPRFNLPDLRAHAPRI
jgi:microcystin-dependent protein